MSGFKSSSRVQCALCAIVAGSHHRGGAPPPYFVLGAGGEIQGPNIKPLFVCLLAHSRRQAYVIDMISGGLTVVVLLVVAVLHAIESHWMWSIIALGALGVIGVVAFCAVKHKARTNAEPADDDDDKSDDKSDDKNNDKSNDKSDDKGGGVGGRTTDEVTRGRNRFGRLDDLDEVR